VPNANFHTVRDQPASHAACVSAGNAGAQGNNVEHQDRCEQDPKHDEEGAHCAVSLFQL